MPSLGGCDCAQQINFIAIVVANLSFAYARYGCTNTSSATVSNPFGKHVSAAANNPFMDRALSGDWMKNEVIFALVIPVGFLAIGFALAVKK